MHTGAADLLRENIPKILKGENVATPARIQVAAVAVDPADLKVYEGVYQSEHGQKFTVRSQPWGFFAGDRQLVPTSPTSFYSFQDFGRVEFVRDPNGGIERLDWEWQGQMMPWKRIGDASASGDE